MLDHDLFILRRTEKMDVIGHDHVGARSFVGSTESRPTSFELLHHRPELADDFLQPAGDLA